MHDLEHLEAYVDGELEAEERARFEDHLEGCAACREALAARRAFRTLAREVWDRPAPEDLKAAIARRLAESPAEASEGRAEAPGRDAGSGSATDAPPRWRRYARWEVLVPLGAAAGVVVVLAVLRGLPPAPKSGLRPFTRPATVCVLRNGEEPGGTVVIQTGPLILD
jgi:anti-sigma factor (TIGR02949 family)